MWCWRALRVWITLLDFTRDLFIEAGVNLISLTPEDVPDLASLIGEYKLDFDDAYQYLAAQQNALTLVSFDTDFDRMDGGKKTPGQVLHEAK